MKYILLSLLTITAIKAITPDCEAALINATKQGMKYANTNKGYKIMISADHNVTKLCEG